MSDTQNQRPENNPPPKKGGLLSNYKSAGQAPPPQYQNNQQQSRPGVPPTPPAQQGPARTHSSLLRDYSQAPEQNRTVGAPGQQPSAQRPPAWGQQPQQPQRPPQQPPQYPPNQAQRPAQSMQSMYNGQQPPMGPPYGQQRAPMSGQPWSAPVNMMRAWSGKMAAAMGQSQQPPAPQMVRYRPSTPPNPPSLGGASNNSFGAWKRSLPVRLSRQKRQRRGKSKGRRIIATVVVSMVVLILISTLGGSAYAYNYYNQQLPLMQRYANKQISQNTRIYDRNGVLLYEDYDKSGLPQTGRRVAVQFQDIPKVMQDAMISIEDKNFWSNAGVDPLAIVRAGTSSGGGASTLTQQLIKNLSGNDQTTYQRKISEASMAIGLTQNYSKAKIMEMYFNVAPFGANTYGVEVAAEDLFNLQPVCIPNKACIPGITQLEYNSKTKKNDPILGLARATLLAAIPNNPSLYDPTLGSDKQASLLGRQKLVLQDMINQGRSVDGQPITTAMAQQAEADAAKMPFHPYKGVLQAPHFVEYVIQQVETALGNGDAQAGAYKFVTGGYNIRTTIDVNLVNYSQAAIVRHLDQPDYQKYKDVTVTLSANNNVNNAAVVVLDSKNGEILSMVGSANYNSTDPKVKGQYNSAISARPPGSTFKPFDYATAFEMGWNPGIVLQDTRTYFPNGAAAGTQVATKSLGTPLSPDYTVSNHENEANGVYSPSDYGSNYWNQPFTNRYATENSFNIAAIRTMQFTGQQAVLNTTRRLGITGLKANGLSLAIGSQDVSPLQMADAYQAFADGGNHVPTQSILDIWDNYGHSLYHFDEQHPPTSRVFSPQVAYMMTSVLDDEPSRDFEFHNIHDLSFTDIDPSCAYNAVCGHQVAAKTGTTDSFADNWTIGYTPDVVVAVWAGNSDDSAMNQVIGITGAAPIWHSVIERTLGQCNYNIPWNPPLTYPDGIACGPNYHFSFSAHPDWMFPTPAGINQYGTIAGLPANVDKVDWTIANE